MKLKYTINKQDYELVKVKDGFTYLQNIRTKTVIPFSEQDLKNYKLVK